ncbi:MAG: phosphoheptose isomerase [Verrucomicrobiota bacterium]
MKVDLCGQETRLGVFEKVEAYLAGQSLSIHSKDLGRPWGGFFAINEDQAETFARLFFPELSFEALRGGGRLSPKILMVEPHKKLSWQYHHRRAEIWKSIHREVGVVRSPTDEQGPVCILKEGEAIELSQGERHRLVGLETWGVVAEIWLHTDANAPSDEDDIVRLEDEFGR